VSPVVLCPIYLSLASLRPIPYSPLIHFPLLLFLLSPLFILLSHDYLATIPQCPTLSFFLSSLSLFSVTPINLSSTSSSFFIFLPPSTFFQYVKLSRKTEPWAEWKAPKLTALHKLPAHPIFSSKTSSPVLSSVGLSATFMTFCSAVCLSSLVFNGATHLQFSVELFLDLRLIHTARGVGPHDLDTTLTPDTFFLMWHFSNFLRYFLVYIPPCKHFYFLLVWSYVFWKCIHTATGERGWTCCTRLWVCSVGDTRSRITMWGCH